MQEIFYLSFEYLFLNIFFLFSCLGFGKLITNNFIKFNNIYDLKNIDFIFGLITIGIISIFINFFISDTFTDEKIID